MAKDEEKLTDCQLIAKEYCRRNNFEFIYADLYSFGYEDTNGNLVKKYWEDLYKELGGK